MKTNIYIFDHVSIRSSYNEKFFRKKIVEEIKTHVLFSATFVSKIIPLLR